MLSNHTIHKVAWDIQRIAGMQVSVWNENGECIESTEPVTDKLKQQVRKFVRQYEGVNGAELVKSDTGLFSVVLDENRQLILAVVGDKHQVEIVGRMGVSQIQNLNELSGGKLDPTSFLQNVLLDNLLMVDIHNKAKRLHIISEKRRIVFVVESKDEGNDFILETMKGLFSPSMGDYVVSVEEKKFILVKSLGENEGYEKAHEIAKMIVDTLSMEALTSVRVSYGTITEDLKELSRSYKEAGVAMDVGRVFYSEKDVLAYNHLGIGRLIHQLPTMLCEMFLHEVLDGRTTDIFDEEELLTVNAFFDNSLNISETARQLFIHRNTLVYRLEKIQKKTGLDVRIFDDALTFKIAVMVDQHLKGLYDN